jgi:hypothetical protein
MLQTIKIFNKNIEKVVLKKINNIFFILLNYNQNFYKNTHIIKKYEDYFSNSFIIYFLRIIWRGKAFRVRYFKKNNKFTLNFGYSHWLKLLFSPNIFKFVKLKRQNYLVLFENYKNVWKLQNFFNNLKKMNKYTKRGIRVKNTSYIKRFGKISQINSSSHSFG